MTNDTNTLNGALQELGETIANNLQTMGVTDASASDGLTTLANRILDIQSGMEFTLTGDKSVLSAYDNETLTLTASFFTGFTVELYDNDDVLVDEMTDNEDGTYSYTYSATGAGDIGFYAKVGTLVSEIYVVEDCLYAHIPEWNYQRSSNAETVISFDDNLSLNLPSSFTLEWDYKGTIKTGRFGLFPKTSTLGWNYSLSVQIDTNDYDGIYRDTSTHGMDSGRLTADNTQYNNCKIIYNNNAVTWLLGGTNTATANNITWITSHNPYTLGLWVWKTGTNYVKNVKIKPL